LIKKCRLRYAVPLAGPVAMAMPPQRVATTAVGSRALGIDLLAHQANRRRHATRRRPAFGALPPGHVASGTHEAYAYPERTGSHNGGPLILSGPSE
jgi:hypothetical protein